MADGSCSKIENSKAIGLKLDGLIVNHINILNLILHNKGMQTTEILKKIQLINLGQILATVN